MGNEKGRGCLLRPEKERLVTKGFPRATCWIIGRHRSSCSQRNCSDRRCASVSSDGCCIGFLPFLFAVLIKVGYALACTATEPVYILGERDRHDLEGLGHRRVDVDEIDEII